MGFYSRMGRTASVSALLGLLSLTGCSLFKDDPAKGAACPTIGTVPDLARLSRFLGTDTAFNNMTYRATLDDVRGSCAFGDGSVTTTATVNLLAERGPAGRDGTQSFDYFVAVADDDGNILNKQTFTAPLTFAPGQGRAGSAEGLKEVIPVPNPQAAVRYHVVIGFQLTPAEHAYNVKVGQ